MSFVVRMFIFLAAAGILSAVGVRMLDTFLGMIIVALALSAFVAGIVNFYWHARTRWPFRRDH